jgi:hypothetical protein
VGCVARRRPGKLTGLGWLLLTHGDELEADFQLVYGLELLGCTVRRAAVLTSQLPAESRIARALNEHLEWSTTDHLLATVIDAIQINTWVLASAHSDPKKSPKKPEPLERPGAKKAKPAMGSGRDLLKIIG